MPHPEQTQLRNRILALLTPEDYAVLAPHLEPVRLPKTMGLVEADGPIDVLFFPETGIGSIVATSPEGQEAEVGLFGCDGVAPPSAILGSDTSPNRIIMQIGGEGHRIARSVLDDAMAERAALRALFLRYAQALHVQTAFTALSNAVHAIDERLARWLLMCHDRHTNDELPLTHDFLSIMLAVRRPSVTTALHVLEGNRFIKAERGFLTIRDRKALEEFAGDAYGKPEAEYRRLIGPMR